MLTLQRKHNLKPVNNKNSCNSFNTICLSKVTLLQLNESRNYKLRFDACCNKSPTLLMYAKCTRHKQENASIFYHWTWLFVS